MMNTENESSLPEKFNEDVPCPLYPSDAADDLTLVDLVCTRDLRKIKTLSLIKYSQ